VVADVCVAVYGGRDRTRAPLRAAFPKRRGRLVFVRTASELARVLRTELVDAVVVELSAGSEDAWSAAALARDFPSAPFLGSAPLRASEGSMLARCAALGMADVLVEGVDDAALKTLLAPALFTARFASAFAKPPLALGLRDRLQLATWGRLVAAGGRLTRTSQLSAALDVTREHLSRTFGSGAPSLKAVIDLVRVVAAGELARNPGHRIRDVAEVLGFATASHLARATARVAGCTPSALARTGAPAVLERFAARHAGRVVPEGADDAGDQPGGERPEESDEAPAPST
jgi:AraC-like DNA-binding protein